MYIDQQDIKKAVALSDEICVLDNRLKRATETVNQLTEQINQKENALAEIPIPVGFYKIDGIMYQKTEHAFRRINPIVFNT